MLKQSPATLVRVLLLSLFVCVGVCFMAGCRSDDDDSPTSTAENPTAGIPTPDYAEKASWLAFPDNPDEYPVDILWFYPTVLEEGDMLMDYTDPDLLQPAQDTIDHQASVFMDSANLYAPFYRQLNKEGFCLETSKVNELLSYGQDDMWRAIVYYLEHYNNGKPFIIAGHSQGSSNLMEILKANWGTTGMEDLLVAAYLIGYSVMPDDIAENSFIRMCESPTDTNCFVTYNSVRDGMQDQSIQITPGTWVTNPLSWESSIEDGELVPAEQNLGAVFFPDGEDPVYYPFYTSAQIKDSGLACDVADPALISPSSMPEGIYHRDDYSLFYENLRANANERIQVFLGKTEKNQLKVYSSMDHLFMEDLMTHFRETSLDDDGLQLLTASKVKSVIKLIGTVAQLAGKVDKKTAQNAFEASVFNDLSIIKEKLDNLEDQIEEGFNNVNAKLAECEVLDTWNSLCDNQLVVIDTAWNHYLDPDGIEGLINVVTEKNIVSTETYQDAVDDFVLAIESMGVTHIETALEDIKNHITGRYSSFTEQVVDYLSLEYIDAYKDPDVFDSILASYLNFYMQMIHYQLKGTILLAEYYNYTDVAPEDVVLTEDGYETITSETAKRKIESLLTDFETQLAYFVNGGERLISQFNAGDIYRAYEDPDDLVRNSDYFPFIDYFIKITYGYKNLFVFRLAWSEEMASGDMGFPDYEALYEDLSDSDLDIGFVLDDGAYTYHPDADTDYPLNLSCISTFKLYAEGDSSTSFNGGVRRYVFTGFISQDSSDDAMELQMTDTDVSKSFLFEYNNVFSETIPLCAADGMEVRFQDLLEQNNPLSIFENNPQCISFTFGAYMTAREYLKETETDTLYDADRTEEEQAVYLYGAMTDDHYYVETMGNQHIEVNDKKETPFFTVVPAADDSISGIKDGDKVVIYMMYEDYVGYPEYGDVKYPGYMYQDTHERDKAIKFKAKRDKAIEFNIHKKYIYPSGKLYTDDTSIRKMDMFMLVVDDVCAHGQADDDHRLEFETIEYNNKNNWFFITE